MRATTGLAVLALSISGCGDAEKPVETMPVAIPFAVTVRGQPFECGKTYESLGSTGRAFTALDLRFFVHGFTFFDAHGKPQPVSLAQDGVFQVGEVALLDFEGDTERCDGGTREVRSKVTGTVPKGRYRGLRFKLGVPALLNHADQALAPSPLNLSSLFWTWQDGYKFLRFEGKVSDGGAWFFHLGSTGCTEERPGKAKCAHENVADVRLDDYEPGRRVSFDLGLLLSGVDLSSAKSQANPGSDVGCMSGAHDGECASVFERLGLPFEGRPRAAQSVFKAE